MTVDPADQLAREQALAERHKPLLVLYPEISTANRSDRKVEGWQEQRAAPLSEDYHPRDIKLVLDHSRIPGWKIPSGQPVHRGDELMDEMEKNSADRIDILVGPGHANRDEFWAEYYRIVQSRDGHDHEPYPHCAYAHIEDGRQLAQESPYQDLIAIEYWLFYLYNDWKSTHEGDWELIVIFLKKPSESGSPHEPIACAYSAHHGGYRLPWRQVEKVDDQVLLSEDGSHPVVYVANGSHANYFYGPGRYGTSTELFGLHVTSGEFPFSGDFADFTTSFQAGARVFPELKVVPPPVDRRWSGKWRWLNFRGQWGSEGVPQGVRWLPASVRFRLFRRIWGAPASLPTRRNWSDPFTWADQESDGAMPPDSWLARQHP